MKAYIQTSELRIDGRLDCFQTIEAPAKIDELPWQKAGLTWTASGHGMRIPTRYKVQYHGRWRRVYCRQYSNAGTCFIGNLKDQVIITDIY